MKKHIVVEIDLPEDRALETVNAAFHALKATLPSLYPCDLLACHILTENDMVVRFDSNVERSTFVLERSPPTDIKAHLQELISTPSDINEHLAYLAEVARGKYVTEFGCRYGASTTALVSSALWLNSYDIDPQAISLVKARLKAAHNLLIHQASTLEVVIPVTDILFIDSLHTYTQLLAELTKHQAFVKEKIIMHDTVTFGEVSEDGSTPGLRAAVASFLASFPEWNITQDFKHNNGLMVLSR